MGVDLADMQLISKCNKGIKYLLCVVDLFSTYAWIVSLKGKKSVTAVNAFQCILDNSKKKNKQNMGWSRQWTLWEFF